MGSNAYSRGLHSYLRIGTIVLWRRADVDTRDERIVHVRRHGILGRIKVSLLEDIAEMCHGWESHGYGRGHVSRVCFGRGHGRI